jgi:hypothetical protein
MRRVGSLTRRFAPRQQLSSLIMRPTFFVLLSAALIVAFSCSTHAQQPGFTPREESPEEYPAGTGRDDTFYACTACHNFKLIAQQGMSRRQWDETISMMVEKHNMPPIDDKDRQTVLNYLEATYPPTAPAAGGWQNPFLNR